MPNLKLSYFDFHGGRGEAARLALSIGSVPFADDRLPPSGWPVHKEKTRFHALPELDIDGEIFTQSNAINRYVGKLANLYPENPVEALRCDEVMDAIEDVVNRIVSTFGIEDEEEMKARRKDLVDGPIGLYLERLQELLAARGGEYFADGRLTVADLKVFVWVRSLRAGILDHVPTDLVDRVAPLLIEHCDRVAGTPAVVAYYDAN